MIGMVNRYRLITISQQLNSITLLNPLMHILSIRKHEAATSTLPLRPRDPRPLVPAVGRGSALALLSGGLGLRSRKDIVPILSPRIQQRLLLIPLRNFQTNLTPIRAEGHQRIREYLMKKSTGKPQEEARNSQSRHSLLILIIKKEAFLVHDLLMLPELKGEIPC